MIQGSVAAIRADMPAFLGAAQGAREVVHTAVGTILDVLEADPRFEALFDAAVLEDVFRSMAIVIGKNPHLVADGQVLRTFVEKAVKALVVDAPDGQPLFSAPAAGRVLGAGLSTIAVHADVLVGPDDPRESLLADVVEAVATGLAAGLQTPGTDADAGNAALRRLLSTETMIAIASDAFAAVAAHPEKLLNRRAGATGPRTTALAQILGSVAAAVAEDPAGLATASTYRELAGVAIDAAVPNIDLLIDLDDDDPKTNELFRILRETLTAVATADDRRGLVDRSFVGDVAKRLLPVVASKAKTYFGFRDAAADEAARPITRVVGLVMGVAGDLATGSVGTDRLPGLIATTVEDILKGTVDPFDTDAVRAHIVALAAR